MSECNHDITANEALVFADKYCVVCLVTERDRYREWNNEIVKDRFKMKDARDHLHKQVVKYKKALEEIFNSPKDIPAKFAVSVAKEALAPREGNGETK